jgi:uncharacterized membrane protein (GlpM family)
MDIRGLMKAARSNGWVTAFGLHAFAFVGLAVAGAVRAFSGVPYWDMWDGYLGWFIKVSDGDWTQWWAQHNEHRIVLSRLLFWVDLEWLGGTQWLLIAANFLLVGLTVLVFWLWLRDSVGADARRPVVAVLALFVVSWLFLWSQQENLTWGFQSQFFLAGLIPLCAFYRLHRSIADAGGGVRDFAIACAFGVASIGALANGVIALPLMTVFALLARQKASRVGVLAALSAATLALYFYGYQPVVRHGSLLLALTQDPVGMVKYVSLYLGSPFFWILGANTIPGVVYPAALAGLFLVAASLWFAVKALRQPRSSSLQLALLFFILYVGGTAFGTAGGRLALGLSAASSSRYTTLALMAWAALLVLFSPAIVERARTAGDKVLWVLAALAIVMTPLQLHALKSQAPIVFGRDVAALALELGVRDQQQIGTVSPSLDLALPIARVAAERHLSVFGRPPLVDLNTRIGRPVSSGTPARCQGGLDGTTAVGDARFVRVSGWILDGARDSVPKDVAIVDKDGRLVGYALTGAERADIRDTVSPSAYYSGLEGYVLSDQIGEVVSLVGGNGECVFSAVVPR